MINWKKAPDLVWTNPKRAGGKWCFKGTRLAIERLFDCMGDYTVEEFCEAYPSVTPDHVRDVLEFMHKESLIPAHKYENPI